MMDFQGGCFLNLRPRGGIAHVFFFVGRVALTAVSMVTLFAFKEMVRSMKGLEGALARAFLAVVFAPNGLFGLFGLFRLFQLVVAVVQVGVTIVVSPA
jgi:hypothetical protein